MGGIFLGAATADNEIRAIDISMPLHLVQGKGEHLGKLFPEHCWGAAKSEKITRQSRAGHLQNGADGKLSDRRPSYCAVVLRMMRLTKNKNLGF
jgi:hypothetical protein